MKKLLLIVSYLGFSLWSVAVFCQDDKEQIEALDEVVFTATKFKTLKKNVGKNVYSITQKTLKNSQGKTILDLLNDVPGIEINGNFSTKGQNLGYYIRGGRNRQVAILIDGVNVNDPSSFNGDFDLRQIDLNQIESIEIIKGGASVLYGTGAATGVINIILKQASLKLFSGALNVSTGSNSTSEQKSLTPQEFSTSVNLNGTLNKLSYLLALNANSSGGISAAESTTNEVFLEDEFIRYNALVKLNYKLNTKLSLGLLSSFDEFSSDFDGFNFDPITFNSIPADKNNTLKSKQKRLGVNMDYLYKKGTLKLRTFFTTIKRDEVPSNDFFEGEVLGFDLFNNFKINSSLMILSGITGQHQDMTQKTAFSTINAGSSNQYFIDPYVSFNYFSKSGFNINLGARLNNHSEYGNNFVFNINPFYNFNRKNHNFKIFTAFSTAFITPTLSEIFTKLPSIERLLPEETKTLELGLEYNLKNKFSCSATFFYREETNKIAFDSATFQTINSIGTFLARGLETEILYNIAPKLTFLANYTYINRADNLLLKIPKHKFFTKLDYQLFTNMFTSINYRYVSNTKDFGNIDLPSYNLFDFFMNHTILDKKLTFYGSITNIFNENFQEIAGFSTRGRNYNLGVKLLF